MVKNESLLAIILDREARSNGWFATFIYRNGNVDYDQRLYVEKTDTADSIINALRIARGNDRYIIAHQK